MNRAASGAPLCRRNGLEVRIYSDSRSVVNGLFRGLEGVRLESQKQECLGYIHMDGHMEAGNKGRDLCFS